MFKRPASMAFSSPISSARRRFNFDSPRPSIAAALTAPGTRRRRWTNRPMYRKPRFYRMYRTPDVPKGCEGPCKVQSFDAKDDIGHMGKVICLSDVTRGTGLTHRVGKRFCVKSIYFVGKIWIDENIKVKNHTNTVMFWVVRDRRPTGTPLDFQQVFNVYDNEPAMLLSRTTSVIVFRFYEGFMQRSPEGNMQLRSRRLSESSIVLTIMLFTTTRRRQSMRTTPRMLCYCTWHVLMPLTQCMRLLNVEVISTILSAIKINKV
ncbi:V1 protein [Sida yellow vein Madurai virus]|uniref:Capsid protein n=1 Tax=Sida yellow vein Madurai virus TaxID=420255 RepID=Q17ZR1_9GEMI|nr:V1 protein [Sida yellow vein Madurai virus]CAJ90736.1 V1 protein [Sida yellow vein Madurai virus]